MAAPGLQGVYDVKIMPKARQYWPPCTAGDISLRENTIQSLRSFFKPDQQSLDWVVALKGQKEMALEVADTVRELLDQVRH